MKTIRLNGIDFTYDDQGKGPAVLLLSGWCQDHRLFKTLVPDLARDHRVINFDWRGHGLYRGVPQDFGITEQADDLVTFLDALGVETVLPVSTSHGGWANIAVTDRLGPGRIPQTMVIDWIQTKPVTAFFTALDEIQNRKTWLKGRQDLFDYWIGATGNHDVIEHVAVEMAGYDFDMWARSCREIATAYAKWGCPLDRMAAMSQKRPVTHVFSQPFEEDYHQAQKDFAAGNNWYRPIKLPGETHFPTLEQPAAVAREIRAALQRH